MIDHIPPQRSGNVRGLPYALGAYGIWGFLPVLYYFLRDVPPLELVGWRVILSLPVCALFLLLFRQTPQFLTALRQPRTLALLLASATLIGVNWLVFVYAIQTGHVLATSLGYYINPMINVLLGTVFLKERLAPLQWVAVALALTGVALLALGALNALWISLTLGISFASYGLIRKIAPVESLPGLTIETLLWLLPALGVVIFHAGGEAGSALAREDATPLWLAGTGLLTAIPLILFATAARLMDYSALGFVQYLAPSISFVLGITLFEEPLEPVQLATFGLIWTGIGFFSWSALAERRRARALRAQPPT